MLKLWFFLWLWLRMTKKNVLVIDAGLGNIGSVIFALNRLTSSVCRLSHPPNDALSEFSHVVLPGVGSFSAGVDSLMERGWFDWIVNHWAPSGRPFLGICLGMQLLASYGCEGSSDASPRPGLSLIPGSVNFMDFCDGLSLPHVGWNSVDWLPTSSIISQGIPQGGDFYFVHSYSFRPDNMSHALATTNYGSSLVSVVGSNNFFGVQFHPEKSQRLGKSLLTNFLSLG